MNEPPLARPGVGVGIVILRPHASGHEVVLIRRGNPPRKGEWSIPGGRQELGETVREAAVREAHEETGLIVANPLLIDVVDGIFKSPDGKIESHWTLVDFWVAWTDGELRAGGDATDAKWVPLPELVNYKLWPETIRIITAGAAAF